MNNIKWEDGAVCFGNGKQWYSNDSGKHNRPLVNIVGNEFVSFEFIANSPDFQLNEIRTGDYIKASELDTEQKFNNAVEEFGLLGFACYVGYETFKSYGNLYVRTENEIQACSDNYGAMERKLTYSQLMAIGKLKRAVLGREKSAPKTAPEIPDSSKRNKSKQAYDILKSLDYEYDLVNQRWFKKHCI
ncbi:hypothetical protein [Pseudoalteromonas phage C7]|uniref:ATPase n=1 Tax=Pseudoalteromonas phage C7 TaxID=2510494 RepID=UPI0010182444|nr:ATPase [Pseudoalteromonas phage C7]QAY17988.1 hypothetical protein [Pseudoalteromonas phage C7]